MPVATFSVDVADKSSVASTNGSRPVVSLIHRAEKPIASSSWAASRARAADWPSSAAVQIPTRPRSIVTFATYRPSVRQPPVLRHRERDRVAVRVLDHDRVDAIRARRFGIRGKPRGAQPPRDLVDVAHDQRARSLTGSFGRRVDLKATAALQLPLDDLCHRLASRTEQLLIPRR